MSKLLLYIHIPFCIHHCRWCTACVLTGGSGVKSEYLAALTREMDAAVPELQRYDICGIYVGGGSPSCMHPDLLNKTVKNFTSQLSVRPGTEKTIELMPQTVCTPSLSGIRTTGYTRFSLSMQSADPGELEALDCGFTPADVRNAVLFLDKFRMNTLNLDLMVNIPGQTPDSWRRTLSVALDYSPCHISIYAFPGEGDVSFVQDDLLAIAGEFLAGRGFRHYARNHWALPGRHSRWHTSRIDGVDYWGLGLGARSLVEGITWSNTNDWQLYREKSEQFTAITTDVRQLTTEELAAYKSACKSLSRLP